MLETRVATCPTCKQTGKFEYLGEQHWPPDVAKALNLPTTIILWSCSRCHTTISEMDLLPARATAPSKSEVSKSS
ncbi:MAG: hypothetical protein ABI947_12550 [Chloroflexota bacterium]